MSTRENIRGFFRLVLFLSFLALLASCRGGGGGGGGTTGGSPSSNADLASLNLSSGTLNPTFSSSTLSYAAMFVGQSSITITPTAKDDGATITVNGESVTSGQPSSTIALDSGDNTITVVVTAADGTTTKTYTITAGLLSQEAFLKASNAEMGDNFGYSVAVSGDTLVVGAHGEDSSAAGGENDNSVSKSGAVYVFTRTGGIWSQQAYIKAFNAQEDDHFGMTVAVSGDTLAVGAYSEATLHVPEQNSTYSTGAVYVYTRTGTTWSQQAYLKASNAGVGDEFGRSVAVSGDTLAVGAMGEDSSATGGQSDNSAGSSGAVYVFTRTGTSWSQQAYLKASNAEANDYFGVSVAVSGDTLAVGAHGEASSATGGQSDNSAPYSGAVYVFTRTGTSWSQQAYLKASNAEANDYFGVSVAVSGDTLAVGAHGEDSSATGGQNDNSAPYSGAVYVFTRTGTSWSQQAYLKASNAEANDYFGVSVALSEDTLAVGANNEDSSLTGGENDNSAAESGAVYVYTRTGTVWSQQAYLKASNAEANDYFGVSVALSEDTLAVGAIGEASSATGGQSDNSAGWSGAVYILK